VQDLGVLGLGVVTVVGGREENCSQTCAISPDSSVGSTQGT